MNDRRVGAIRTGHPFPRTLGPQPATVRAGFDELPAEIAQTCGDVSVHATSHVNDDETVADRGQSEDEPQTQRFVTATAESNSLREWG